MGRVESSVFKLPVIFPCEGDYCNEIPGRVCIGFSTW